LPVIFQKRALYASFLIEKVNQIIYVMRYDAYANVNDLKAFSKPETFIISCKSEKYWQDYRVTGNTL
jgi:hypothetical protein